MAQRKGSAIRQRISNVLTYTRTYLTLWNEQNKMYTIPLGLTNEVSTPVTRCRCPLHLMWKGCYCMLKNLKKMKKMTYRRQSYTQAGRRGSFTADSFTCYADASDHGFCAHYRKVSRLLWKGNIWNRISPQILQPNSFFKYLWYSSTLLNAENFFMTSEITTFVAKKIMYRYAHPYVGIALSAKCHNLIVDHLTRGRY